MCIRDRVKVADFGIARAVSSQTIGVNAVGSVHYISPEQAKGNYSDGRSDLYSLGITMYEMLTGKLPFDGDTPVSVALAHLEEPVQPPSLINPEVSASLDLSLIHISQDFTLRPIWILLLTTCLLTLALVML